MTEGSKKNAPVLPHFLSKGVRLLLISVLTVAVFLFTVRVTVFMMWKVQRQENIAKRQQQLEELSGRFVTSHGSRDLRSVFLEAPFPVSAITKLTWAGFLAYGEPVFRHLLLRSPNAYERFYRDMAVHYQVPDLCDKIAYAAYDVPGFGSEKPGRGIWSLRSECHESLAKITLDASLCRDVRPVGFLPVTLLFRGMNLLIGVTSGRFDAWDGSQVNENNCRKSVEQLKQIPVNKRSFDWIAARDEDVSVDETVMRELGYQRNHEPMTYAWESHYLHSYDLQNGVVELIKRTRKLPDFD